MSPIEWLCAKAPGFYELAIKDRDAIMHFSLLWSLFEGEALGKNASAKAILALVHGWEGEGRLDFTGFAEGLDYFRARYFQNGCVTKQFLGLQLRKNDNATLVKAVLKGENTNTRDCVVALLIVVYRLRNNLFHGEKWAYGIHGQLDNFTHANAVLMKALELHCRL